MAEYSSILLENAVESLSKLPGIGKKTALRLALHLLNEDQLETEQLADSLLKMKSYPVKSSCFRAAGINGR